LKGQKGTTGSSLNKGQKGERGYYGLTGSTGVKGQKGASGYTYNIVLIAGLYNETQLLEVVGLSHNNIFSDICIASSIEILFYNKIL